MLRLRLARQAQDVSAEQIACRLGISAGYLRLVESGRMAPTRQLRQRLTDEYGHGADALLEPINVDLPQIDLRRAPSVTPHGEHEVM